MFRAPRRIHRYVFPRINCICIYEGTFFTYLYLPRQHNPTMDNHTTGFGRMARKCHAVGMILPLLVCGGCVNGTTRQGLMGADKPDLLNKTSLTTFNYTDKTSADYYLNKYDAATTADDRKTVRNRILNDLKGVIDYNYHQFEDGLRVDVTLKNTTADVVTLGLTAASTAASANAVKTLLSALATGVVGVNTSLDKNIFQSNTVQALQLEMRTLRSTVEVSLNKGMQAADADYTLEQGIQDIIAYYYAGSLTDALLGLVKQTGTSATETATAATAARKPQT